MTDEQERLKPLVDAHVEEAIAPYRKLLTPAQLEAMRDALEEAAYTHPVLRAKLLRLAPAPVVATSGEVAVVDDGAGERELGNVKNIAAGTKRGE
jgi:hypothetical protein